MVSKPVIHAAIVIASAACAAASPAQQSQGVNCLFGSTAAMTGPSAGLGKLITEGAQLAQKRAAAELKIGIELGWRDGQNLPAPTVNGFQALAAQGATAVMVNGTDPLLATAPLGERLKRIVFNIAAVTPAQRTMNDWVFGNAVLADTEAAQIVGTAKSVFKVTEFAIIYDDNAYGDMFRKFIALAAKDAGLKITMELPIKPGASDLRPQIRKLLDIPEHQAIIFATTGTTPGTAIKQAKELGVKANYWIGQQFTWTVDAVRSGGAAAEGSIATTPLFDASASPKARQFADNYQAAYGSFPDAMAGRSYDSIYALATAARNAGTCDADKVRLELLKLNAYEGVTGTLDFSHRIAEGRLTWGVIRDGKMVAVKPEDLVKK